MMAGVASVAVAAAHYHTSYSTPNNKERRRTRAAPSGVPCSKENTSKY